MFESLSEDISHLVAEFTSDAALAFTSKVMLPHFNIQVVLVIQNEAITRRKIGINDFIND
jgi:hypothetical protein